MCEKCMETPNRKASPFLSLGTPRTAAYLGAQIKMDDNTEFGEDDDIPPEDDDIPPKPVSAPKGGTQKQEKEGPALED